MCSKGGEMKKKKVHAKKNDKSTKVNKRPSNSLLLNPLVLRFIAYAPIS